MLSNNQVLKCSIFPRLRALSPASSLFSSPNLTVLQGEIIRGGKPVKRWRRREAGIHILATAKAAGLGQDGGSRAQVRVKTPMARL